MNNKIKKGLISLVVSSGVLASGCATNYGVEGAALGAGTGAIIGNQHHGQSLEGAAIGGVLGGILGTQVKKKNKQNMYEDPLVYESSTNSYQELKPEYVLK